MVCLAISNPKETSTSVFIKGFHDRKKTHQWAEEHEESDTTGTVQKRTYYELIMQTLNNCYFQNK